MPETPPDKKCPRCEKDVPYWNDHCYSCGHDYDRSGPPWNEPREPDVPPETYTDLILVFSYPGRTQADAATLFGQHAQQLSSQGYRPVSQSWADGRPGAARVWALGIFATAIRPNGYLTVTYERESAGATANASGTLVDRLTQIAEVRRLGLITEEEFAAQRQRILDSA